MAVNNDTDSSRWLDALAGSHDSLTELVGELGGDDLRRQSYCDDWSVAQVLSHLGSGAEIFKASLDAMVAGDPPPGRESFPPIWDRWNAMTPEEQAESFCASDGQLVEALENLGDRLDDMEFTMFGVMQVDAIGFLGMRLSEHALHSWDVAVTFDPTARVSADAVPLLVDRLPMMAARTGDAGGAANDRPYTVSVVTVDPARAFDIAVGESVEMTPRGDGSPGAAGADLVLPSEALIRLVYGRLDESHTPTLDASQKATVADLRKVFRGL